MHSVPENEPTVALNTQNASSNSTYMLFMLDPDASTPENPTSRWIIHWWQANMTLAPASANDASNGGQRLINTTAPRVAYRRPRPPTNSSAHRYIQYVFRQPANFTIPPAFSGYGGSNSSRFPFEDFVDDADLDDPVAANYFFCTNQTAVPMDFIAAAGQQYPGGNGAMVTQGQNEPSRTSAGPSATGSAASTTSAAAGNILENRNSLFGMAVAFGAMAMLQTV